MKTRTLIPTVGLMTGLFATAVSGEQNLVVNGSFESGGQNGMENFPDWGLIGPANNNSDYGVAQSGTFPDVPEQGDFYAYFHGNPTDSSQDCLGQTVNLTVGAQYTVSYYLATDGSTLGSGAGMWVQLGQDFGLSAVDLRLTTFLPNSSNAIPYQQFTTIVTATDATEILSFHGVDATSSILLDNVSMTLVVPQPQLNLSLSPTNTLVFNWNSQTTGFVLQASSSLSTTGWITLTNAPTTTGSTNEIVLPASASSQFYRLALP